MIVLQAIVIIAVLALLVLGFFRRNMPRVGGKLGPIRADDPPRELPSGFSRSKALSRLLRGARRLAEGWLGNDGGPLRVMPAHGLAQNEPTREPSTITTASATRAPMMPTTTMSR
jgi:hypothetical protein